jgi:UDP-hydrolysing UDP-N-acetyl-D-glucosamine 2-epimerase
MTPTKAHPRRICVVTGSRAEFGLLTPLMNAVKADPALALQVVATGMHLSPEFGMTVKAIEEAGFQVDSRVETLLSSDSAVGMAKSIGLGVIGFADAFSGLRPDIVVLLGDRYEIFAAAQAAMVSRTIIAHIHGGEVTEGALDDAMRHCISKMSHVHFVSDAPYRKRLIQLGERPERILDVGSLGIENILNMKLLSRVELIKSIGFSFGEKTLLVTYHPVTLEADSSERNFSSILDALDRFPDSSVIFTRPNSDTDNKVIGRMIDSYVARNPGRAASFASLGQLRYLSAMRSASAVIGNSSSGVIEAPAFGVPSVNIGERQTGRILRPSVIQCKDDRDEIVRAIQRALQMQKSPALDPSLWTARHGEASTKIKDHLKSVDLAPLLKKKFFDVAFEE